MHPYADAMEVQIFSKRLALTEAEKDFVEAVIAPSVVSGLCPQQPPAV